MKLTARQAQAETFKLQQFAEAPDTCRKRQKFALWALFAVYDAYCLKRASGFKFIIINKYR